MKRNLFKTKKDRWKWSVPDRRILSGWFDDFVEGRRPNAVKSNSERDVFLVDSSFGKLYIKYNHPTSLFSRLRSLKTSKSKAEYLSSLLLKKHGVPCIDAIGWGDNHDESILITAEAPGTLTARDFWFSDTAVEESERKRFLSGLVIFLRKFMDSSLYHPDFHPGNLLYRRETGEFLLVDVYGVRHDSEMHSMRIFAMRSFIGAFRGELSDLEAASLIMDSGFAKDASEAERLWSSILDAEASGVSGFWRKRKMQILADAESNYCLPVTVARDTYVIRKSMNKKPLVAISEVADSLSSSEFELMETDREFAQKIWLGSFWLQFHRIPHRRPIVWVKSEGKDRLVFEKFIPDGKSPDESALLEFKNRCRHARILEIGIAGNVVSVDGRLFVYNLKDLSFPVKNI